MIEKAYKLPDPRTRPDAFLVLLYKALKAIEFDDRAWDKEYFPRCVKRCGQLIENVGGDVEAAATCMQDLKLKFESDGMSWTIETICQYSFEWNAQREKKTYRDTLQRFLGEVKKDSRLSDLKRFDPVGLIQAIKELPPPDSEKGGTDDERNER